MKKQNKMDRMDESLGMRDGKAAKKMQGYKDRRDEMMGMKEMGRMGHASKPMKCDALASQQEDVKRLKMKDMDMKGYPKEAYNYNY